MTKNFNDMTAVERAVHRAALAEERRLREQRIAEDKANGRIKSPSDNRKRKKHGRPY